MKKGLLTTVFFAICISMLMAQIPQAFKYQAVVRDLNGMTIADQNINLRISILFGDPAGNEVYSETHPCNTNALGLVNLEIGRGFNPTANIADINWAAGNYYIKIEMDESGGSDFEAMGVAQLLSVPYALHSGTAEQLRDAAGDGVPANNWILFGNSNTDPTEDKLGTTDAADLVIVTDDMERMRVLSDGDVHIMNSAEVGLNLTVKENVNLNTFSGETNNYGPFTVANLSPTLLSGTLTVDMHTDLNSSLNVDGITDLNSAFNVNNESPSLLTGTLLVNKNATFNKYVLLDDSTLQSFSPTTGGLVVFGGTGIKRDLWVGGSAHFDGPLRVNCDYESYDDTSGAIVVVGGVGIGKRLNVGGATKLGDKLTVEGQVTIKPTMTNNEEDDYNHYPLQVEGGDQGIAIKVNGGRDVTNNYVSFWDDDTDEMWGRIEGQTLGNLWSDPEYLLEAGFKAADIIIFIAETVFGLAETGQSVVKLTAAGTSSTACVGLGACVTAPIPSLIVESGTNVIVKIANLVLFVANLGLKVADEAAFIAFKTDQIGVTYQSGAGDYAEWLRKADPTNNFLPGELVGVTNGLVSRNLQGADKIMVVSTNPIVLGNMPPEGEENSFVKIAFMGQVPVKILGDVNPGDYILPSKLGNGFGEAIHPDKMTIKDYNNIVGVVWSVIADMAPGVRLVNIAVGINTNDLTNVMYAQEEKIKALETRIDQSNAILADLVPGYAEATGYIPAGAVIYDKPEEGIHSHNHTKDEVTFSTEEDILYFEVSHEQLEASLDMARESYMQTLESSQELGRILIDQNSESYLGVESLPNVPIEEHPFWKRIDSDPEFKEAILNYVKTSLEKAVHTHKKYAHKFTDLDLHE